MTALEAARERLDTYIRECEAAVRTNGACPGASAEALRRLEDELVMAARRDGTPF